MIKYGTIILINFLFLLNVVAAANNKTFDSQNSLTLFFFSSPNGVNWKTPKKLINSTIKNYSSRMNRTIGHAAIELTCDRFQDKPSRHVLTGMTDNGDANVSQLTKEKLGLGILFENLSGKMEDSVSLVNDIREKIINGRVNFISYKISPTTCQRLSQYYDEYIEMKLYTNYGLPNRPRFKEGAGCSAFAISFLELAGLLTDEHYENWHYTINVPLDLIGGSITRNKISIFKLLRVSKKRHWASEDTPHKKISFWDPDSMFNWVKSKTQNNPSDSDFEIIKLGNIFGLATDRSEVETPTDPIWQSDK